MKYMLLLHTNESEMPNPGTPEFGKIVEGYAAFGQRAAADGIPADGEPLQSIATATTLAVRDGETILTDGPYAETKEQLAGFYIIDVKDLDEAIKYAAMIPAASMGKIEIRPVMVIPGVPE